MYLGGGEGGGRQCQCRSALELSGWDVCLMGSWGGGPRVSVYVYLGRGMCARAGVCRCVSVWVLCLSVPMWMCNESPRRDVPLVLHLDHEHERGEDEAKPADDLWDPEHPIHDGA